MVSSPEGEKQFVRFVTGSIHDDGSGKGGGQALAFQ